MKDYELAQEAIVEEIIRFIQRIIIAIRGLNPLNVLIKPSLYHVFKLNVPKENEVDVIGCLQQGQLHRY